MPVQGVYRTDALGASMVPARAAFPAADAAHAVVFVDSNVFAPALAGGPSTTSLVGPPCGH